MYYITHSSLNNPATSIPPKSPQMMTDLLSSTFKIFPWHGQVSLQVKSKVNLIYSGHALSLAPSIS